MREEEKHKESSALTSSTVTKYSLVNEKVVSRKGFPGSASGKESTCQCRRCGFSPWVGKIPWRRAWKPTPVFLPRESPRRLAGCGPWSRKESDVTERLSTHTHKSLSMFLQNHLSPCSPDTTVDTARNDVSGKQEN